MGDHCNVPGCVGEPPVCAFPGCDVRLQNACSADPFFNDWHCWRHEDARRLTLAEQQRDELAEALRELDRASSRYIEDDDHEWRQALNSARAALRRYDEARGSGEQK